MIGGPPLLGAEMDTRDIIELVVLVVLYFVLPAVGKMFQKQQAEVAGEDELPSFADEPEPAPVAALAAAEEAADPDQRLRTALRMWHATVSPVLGRRPAESVERLVEERFPALSGSMPWDADERMDAEAVADALTGLALGIGAITTPEQRLQAAAVAELVAGLAPGRQATAQSDPAVLPVGLPISGRAAWLAEEAGYTVVVIPQGPAPPLRRFELLRSAVRTALLQDSSRLEPFLRDVYEGLAGAASQSRELGASVSAFVRHPAATSVVVEAVVDAVVARHTGPLGALTRASGGGDASRAVADATYSRAALRSRLVSAADSDVAVATVWQHVADLVSDGLEAIPWGGDTAPNLGSLVRSWGPSEDAYAEETGHWLAAAARGRPPELPLPPPVALVAWTLRERDGDRLRPAVLQSLADAVEGRVTAAAPEPAATTARPASVLGTTGLGPADALVLQVLLGPPRARSHPLLPGGPRPAFNPWTPRP